MTSRSGDARGRRPPATPAIALVTGAGPGLGETGARAPGPDREGRPYAGEPPVTGTPLSGSESDPGTLGSAAPPAAPDDRKGSSPSEGYRGAPWPSSGSWPEPPPGSRPAPPPAPGVPAPLAAATPTAESPAVPEAGVAAPAAPPAPRTVAPPELPRPITVTPGTPPPRYASELWFPGPRRTFADEQVWPPVARPADEEPPESSTQPFPAVPAVPAVPAPPPAAAPGEPGEADGTASGAPEAGPPAADGVVLEPRASGEGTPAREETVPPRRRTAPRTGAVSLIAVLAALLAALLAVALAVGIPTWNGYRLHRGDVFDPRVHVVTPGGTGVLMNVAWKVGVEQAGALPDTRPAGPGLRWLKITVTRTSLNAEGVARRAAPGIEVRHPDGRSWQAEIVRDGLPAGVGDHLIGAGYTYEAISLVPQEVAGQVEVRITPSAVRMPLRKEPAEMFARKDTGRPEPQDQVLLFRR